MDTEELVNFALVVLLVTALASVAVIATDTFFPGVFPI